MSLDIQWRPRIFDSPLAIVPLNLGVKIWFFSNPLEVIFHPLKQVLTPIPASHVLNRFATVTRVLRIVFGPLIWIVVFPLTDHTGNIVSVVDVFLIPIYARGASEHLVRVNVPILQSLNPIDASIVGPECFVDVATFVVIVVHVRVQFTKSVACWPGKEPFHNISA